MGGVLYGTLTAELAVKTMLVVAKEVRKNLYRTSGCEPGQQKNSDRDWRRSAIKFMKRGIAMELIQYGCHFYRCHASGREGHLDSHG